MMLLLGVDLNVKLDATGVKRPFSKRPQKLNAPNIIKSIKFFC
jgi:hypothetical protein